MPPWRCKDGARATPDAAVALFGWMLLLCANMPLSSGAPGALAIPAASELVQWVGRTVPGGDGSVVLDWPGVSASLTLTNMSYLRCTIRDGTNGTRIAVTVDGGETSLFRGQTVQTLLTLKGRATYDLLHADYGSRRGPLWEEGPLTVRMVNTQEGAAMNTTDLHNLTVLSFETDGQVLPTRRRSHRLEFIGDSITAGMGSGAVEPCYSSIYSDDVMLGYSWRLCEALDAECYIQAVSGIGVYCSFPTHPEDGLYDCNRKTMPQRYNLSLTGVPDGFPWDSSRWTPEAVVMNLGTNDLCCGRWTNGSHQLHYLSTYVGFARSVAAQYPESTPFFLAHGPMTDNYKPMLELVRSRLLQYGLRVYMLDLYLGPDYSVDNGKPGGGGCEGHPSADTHQLVFQKALPQLQKVLKWGT